MERFAGRTERFVGRQNIEHFRAMLKTTTDPGQRKVLEKLLLEAEAKLKKDEEDRKRNNASRRALASFRPSRSIYGYGLVRRCFDLIFAS
jgi:hypothetical protein